MSSNTDDFMAKGVCYRRAEDNSWNCEGVFPALSYAILNQQAVTFLSLRKVIVIPKWMLGF